MRPIYRWLESLESGDYEQYQESLRSNSRFCCLGVAVDTLHPELWVRDEKRKHIWAYETKGNIKNGYMLQIDMLEELEIEHYEQDDLTLMNDTGATFTEIAAYIRSEILPRIEGDRT